MNGISQAQPEEGTVGAAAAAAAADANRIRDRIAECPTEVQRGRATSGCSSNAGTDSEPNSSGWAACSSSSSVVDFEDNSSAKIPDSSCP